MGSIETTELKLYIDNDAQLYRQQMQPIYKNLSLKMKKRTYNRIGATKLFLYLVVNGAKKYAKDFGGKWNVMFSVSDRLAVARALEEDFYNDNRMMGVF